MLPFSSLLDSYSLSLARSLAGRWLSEHLAPDHQAKMTALRAENETLKVEVAQLKTRLAAAGEANDAHSSTAAAETANAQ
jgi:cell division protein FtsB